MLIMLQGVQPELVAAHCSQHTRNNELPRGSPELWAMLACFCSWKQCLHLTVLAVDASRFACALVNFDCLVFGFEVEQSMWVWDLVMYREHKQWAAQMVAPRARVYLTIEWALSVWGLLRQMMPPLLELLGQFVLSGLPHFEICYCFGSGAQIILSVCLQRRVPDG